MITEDYVSFETAKLLKEKMFDEFCPTFYETDEPEPDNGPRYSRKLGWFLHNSYDYSDRYGKMIISAPTLQMAMKWLREIYKLEVRSTYDYDKDSWWGNINPMFEETDENSDIYQKALGFDYQGKSYEEACEVGIKYCLENLI